MKCKMQIEYVSCWKCSSKAIITYKKLMWYCVHIIEICVPLRCSPVKVLELNIFWTEKPKVRLRLRLTTLQHVAKFIHYFEISFTSKNIFSIFSDLGNCAQLCVGVHGSSRFKKKRLRQWKSFSHRGHLWCSSVSSRQ